MTQEVRLNRVQCNYQAENARFLLECDFSKQYSHYYRKRLEKTRPYLEFNCRSRWDPNISIYTLAELAAHCMDGTFSELDEHNESPVRTPTSLSPISGNYKFSKRLRKNSITPSSSKSTPSSSKTTPTTEHQPRTSTQARLESPGCNQEEAGHRNDCGQSESECIVIGTIFKRMKLQPDVVEELSRGDFHVKCDRYLGHYTSPDDTLVLEDADESISLIGNINPKHFVTGVVVALLGVPIDDGGQFLIRDVCFAEPNRQILYDDISPDRPIDLIGGCGNNNELQQVRYLMVLSGLGFHHEMGRKTVLTRALQNLIDFVWGGGDYTDDDRSSQVARVLVVGNCLSEDRLRPESSMISSYDKDDVATRMKKSRQVKPYEETICATNHMDDFFAQLSKTIDVDVMPGPSDPSSHLMPQQPFHPCMFPKSCMFPTFNCTTNPHHAKYDDKVEVFATSGQNVDIVSKFSGINDPIEVMKAHLKWGNCAPSAPDNLYSVPYEDDDPYVIDFIPEIYIAGCQKAFKTDYYYYDQRPSSASSTENLAGETSEDADTTLTSSIVNASNQDLGDKEGDGRHHDSTAMRKDRTLLVSVPEFCDTFSCVLVNLANLECQSISFV